MRLFNFPTTCSVIRQILRDKICVKSVLTRICSFRHAICFSYRHTRLYTDMFFGVAMHKTLTIAFLTTLISWLGPGGGMAVADPNGSYHTATTLANALGTSSAGTAIQDANQQDSDIETRPQSIGLVQTSSNLFGGADGDPNFPLKTGMADTRELFFKMLASVMLVVVLGAVAIYASKRVMGKITNMPGKKIKIIETAHLGPRKAVHLLRIGDRCLLIGSTNDNITRLADLTTEIVMQEYVEKD